MERNDVITTLEVLKANCSKHSRDYQALEYAISSLKTDEAYQIMYEGGEIFTKADMVDMLEKLISEANELEDPKYILETSELPLDVDGTTLPLETYALQCYYRGGEDVIDIIEKKINSLKEDKNGN